MSIDDVLAISLHQDPYDVFWIHEKYRSLLGGPVVVNFYAHAQNSCILRPAEEQKRNYDFLYDATLGNSARPPIHPELKNDSIR